MDLEGRIALVTGGGRGIGRGIVDRLLAEGARVAVAQRSAVEEPRSDVLVIPADLSDPASLAAVVDAVAEHFGGLDILVNNAGVMFERELDELTIDEWQSMIAINLTAPVFLAKAALPHMRRRGGGSIINLGSVEGLAANPGHTAYSTTNGGVHGMTRAMAVDLGADGIRVNAIAPGWITSDLSERYLDSLSDPASARAELERLHPAGRLGQPTDVGDLAVFLASDRSGFVTGQTIVVDGGRTVRLPTPA